MSGIAVLYTISNICSHTKKKILSFLTCRNVINNCFISMYLYFLLASKLLSQFKVIEHILFLDLKKGNDKESSIHNFGDIYDLITYRYKHLLWLVQISQSSYMTYSTTISDHSVHYGPNWDKVILFFHYYVV